MEARLLWEQEGPISIRADRCPGSTPKRPTKEVVEGSGCPSGPDKAAALSSIPRATTLCDETNHEP